MPIKTYRHVLYRYPQDAPAPHYGLAFILLRQGDRRMKPIGAP